MLDALGFSTVPCYCRGTLIVTERGEVAVEDLKLGNKLVTAAGALRSIKWIGRRSYSGRFVLGNKDILPVCIKAGAIADNVPRRDLWISPRHAMCLEGVLIEAKDLINGVSIVQADFVEKVEYFHIELETHDVIIAEGAPSETFVDDDSRGMFHNAHEYQDIHGAAVSTPARYCAPRLDSGHEVEDVRRRIDVRAGLTGPGKKQRLGILRGQIELIEPTRVAGWAQHVDHPEVPVCLDVYVGSHLIGRTLANHHRADLQRAGLGSGRHAFVFQLPDGMTMSEDALEVRRSADGAQLVGRGMLRRGAKVAG
jgi:hypothetical protein